MHEQGNASSVRNARKRNRKSIFKRKLYRSKCNAIMGAHFDEEQVWYLQARGLSRGKSRRDVNTWIFKILRDNHEQ